MGKKLKDLSEKEWLKMDILIAEKKMDVLIAEKGFNKFILLIIQLSQLTGK